MKFHRLTFQAFGSYPDEQVVDFTSLAVKGLFVVTGPTGTGKTTIFDAMVYALYNTQPGERSAPGISPRSQHALPSTQTRVTLEFEAGGMRYRVERTPAQPHPKNKTDIKADAVLVRVEAGSDITVASGATEVAKACVELIGLSANEFQRVVLLPQGKFTQFLLATEDDRETLLSQLFDGGLYERATDHLKKQVDKYAVAAGKVHEDVRHHRTNALEAINVVRSAWAHDLGLSASDTALALDIEAHDFGRVLTDALDEARPVLEQRHAAHVAAVDRNTAARDALSHITLLRDRYRKKIEVGAQRAALQQLEPSVREAALLASQSRGARPVVDAHRSLSEAERTYAEAEGKLSDARRTMTALLAALEIDNDVSDPHEVSTRIASARSRLDGQQAKLVAYTAAQRDADFARTRATQTEQQLHELAQQLESLAVDAQRLNELRLTLSAQASDAERLNAESKAAFERVNCREQLDAAAASAAAAQANLTICDDHRTRLQQLFIESVAPRLADQLAPHEPCPVCGSCEHPNPARHASTERVDETQLAEADAAIETARNERDAANATIIALRTQLGDHVDFSIEELRQQAATCLLLLSAAQDAERDLVKATTALDEHTNREQGVRTAHSDLQEKLTRHRTEADLLTKAAAEAAAAVEGIDVDTVTQHLVHAERAQQHVNLLVKADTEVAAANGAVEQAQRTLDDAIAQSHFADVPTAQAALINPADEDAALDALQKWERDLAAVSARVGEYADAPDTEPDLGTAEANAKAASDALAEASSLYTPMQIEFDRALREHQAAIEVWGAAQDLLTALNTARVVYDTCNGKAALRVPLSRWVLGGELDRVAAAANVHLMRMTNDRFQLRRPSADKKALSLEVFDATTGLARATKSLSGGEQFQASLALALGLADVISMGGSASGKSFDALFIDEGFGSLDAAALDEAINTLRQLHASGRMVGAITHVEAMKTELPVGIEVTRRADGRGSTLKVLA